MYQQLDKRIGSNLLGYRIVADQLVDKQNQPVVIQIHQAVKSAVIPRNIAAVQARAVLHASLRIPAFIHLVAGFCVFPHMNCSRYDFYIMYTYYTTSFGEIPQKNKYCKIVSNLLYWTYHHTGGRHLVQT